MSTQRDGNHSSKLLDTEESLNPISNPRGSLLEAMVPTPQVLFTLRLLMGKFVRENAVPRRGLLRLWESTFSFIAVQSLSHGRLFVTRWTAAHQASLSTTNSWSLLKLVSIEPGMPSLHLVLCRPLLLLPLIFPSIRVFSSELAFFLYVPQNIDRHYVCFSAPFFFFSRLNAAQFFWKFFTGCDFQTHLLCLYSCVHHLIQCCWGMMNLL